jgi:hypothetical protein
MKGIDYRGTVNVNRMWNVTDEKLKRVIEFMAKMTGQSEIDVTTNLQSAAVAIDDDELLDQLSELKWNRAEELCPWLKEEETASLTGGARHTIQRKRS